MTQIQTYEAEMVRDQAKSLRSRIDPVSLLLRTMVWLAALTVAAIFVWLAGYIIIKGLPYLSPRLFEWEYSTENVSMLPAIIVTVLMVLLALLFAAPVGMGAAIYLVEQCRDASCKHENADKRNCGDRGARRQHEYYLHD